MNATRKFVSAVILGLLFSGAGVVASHATVIFSENFEEAILGGTYAPPSTYGTGISPTVGASWGEFLGDYGAVVNGTPIGTGKALAAYDQVSGAALRILAGADTSVSGPVTSGKLQVSYDFVVTGTLAAPGALQFQLQTTSQQSFIQMLAYSGTTSGATTTSIQFNNSTSGAGPDPTTATIVANGTAVNIFMDVNIDTLTYDMTLTRLSDSVVLKSLSGLDFNNGTDLTTTGFKFMDMSFGFSDFSDPSGGGTAALIIDNINVAVVPEPQTVLLLGLAGALLKLPRRRRALK